MTIYQVWNIDVELHCVWGQLKYIDMEHTNELVPAAL